MAKDKQKQPTAKGKDRLELAVKEYIKGVYIEREQKYTFTQALIDAGYKEGYARSHCTDLRRRAQAMIDAEKAKVYAENKYNLEDWEQELKDLYAECRQSDDRTNAKGCLDMAIKLNGGFITITKDVSDLPIIPESDTKLIEEQTRLLNVKLASVKTGP